LPTIGEDAGFVPRGQTVKLSAHPTGLFFLFFVGLTEAAGSLKIKGCAVAPETKWLILSIYFLISGDLMTQIIFIKTTYTYDDGIKEQTVKTSRGFKFSHENQIFSVYLLNISS